ncbi:DUF397 domain-containing protein [Saccharopolyspora pogona]|uniref:DUF397 domain-containing protein n=1 Tax=Saccharopolyspora pogona TaxID=333966 RepID=UPI001687F374|nr:DUF397 domain-containing protein [Saccharopolyspora pogona]
MPDRLVWRKSSYSDNGANCVEVAFVDGQAFSEWRKSCHSTAIGNCVEVAFLEGQALQGWRKSSRSMNQGACVEVAAADGVVAARDSKDPAGPVLVFSRARWASFLARLNG